MKKILVLATAFFAFGTAFSQTAVAPATATKEVSAVLDIKNDAYNFGKITFGKPVEYVVEFKNISADTMAILQAVAGCGCTTPSFTPNEKFGPGQTAKMTIRFNSSVEGSFTRYTDVSFSGGYSKKLTFIGEGVKETAPTAAAAVANKATPTKN